MELLGTRLGGYAMQRGTSEVQVGERAMAYSPALDSWMYSHMKKFAALQIPKPSPHLKPPSTNDLYWYVHQFAQDAKDTSLEWYAGAGMQFEGKDLSWTEVRTRLQQELPMEISAVHCFRLDHMWNYGNPLSLSLRNRLNPSMTTWNSGFRDLAPVLVKDKLLTRSPLPQAWGHIKEEVCLVVRVLFGIETLTQQERDWKDKRKTKRPVHPLHSLQAADMRFYAY